jgi:hypothetical protein
MPAELMTEELMTCSIPAKLIAGELNDRPGYRYN